ncbi:MAG: class I SAM-dependent methyltransferase [Burkholderiaceae bacterium]|nr:MAG: class I SAM-dependent methyltransferase [Burkholderiaceae bacterium]
MKISVGAKAFALQLSTLLVGFLLLSLLHRFFGFRLSPIFFFLSCGLAAALASWILRFDWWWSLIQLFFSSSIYLALQLSLPPWLYFLALIFCLLLFWSTHRTQVPYYPSSDVVVDPIHSLLSEFEKPRFVDVGCGLGGLLFALERRLPLARFCGIEIAPLPYFICVLRRILLRANVKFLFGAYERLNFAEYDVVFCYLSPVAMPAIWTKASSEMTPGSVLLSYEFIIAEKEPSFVLEFGADAPPLYGWRI